MDKERVDKDNLLDAARKLRGLAALEDIRYAVLEQTGDITIISKNGRVAN